MYFINSKNFEVCALGNKDVDDDWLVWVTWFDRAESKELERRGLMYVHRLYRRICKHASMCVHASMQICVVVHYVVRSRLLGSLLGHYHHLFGFDEHTQHRVVRQGADRGVGVEARPVRRPVDAGLVMHHQAGLCFSFCAQIENVGCGSGLDRGTRRVTPNSGALSSSLASTNRF